MFPQIAAAVCAALVVCVWMLVTRRRYETVRFLLWVGLVAPFAVGIQRTDQEAAPALGALDALRFGVPLACLVLAVTTTRPLRRGPGATEWWLGAFLAALMVSAVWSVSPRDSLLKAIITALQFLLLAVLVRRYTSLEHAIRGLVTFVHVILLTVPIGVVVAPSIAFAYDTGGGVRLAGAFPPVHPNLLGILVGVALIALLARVGPRWTLPAGPRTVLALLYIAELVLARTRAALIVGALVLVFTAIRLRYRPGVLLGTLVGAAGIGAVLTVEADTVLGFLARGQSAGSIATLSGRTSLWSASLNLWAQRPWAGYGYYSGHRYALAPLYRGAVQSNVDNAWVETLLDVGLLGTVPLAMFVLWGIVRGLRTVMDRDHGVFAVSALLLLLAASFFNPSVQTVGYAAVLFGFLLLATGPVNAVGGSADTPALAPDHRAAPPAAARPNRHAYTAHSSTSKG